MRAIIRFTTTLTQEQLKNVLTEAKWWPPFSQQDDEVNRHRDEILSLVASDDKEIVKTTQWYTILHTRLRTWGVINNPNPHDIEIRLKNQSSPHLQKACESLITALQKYADTQTSIGGKVIEFNESIEVLEANSQHYAYFGDPLPRSSKEKWNLAKIERRSEWRLGSILLLVALVLMLLTIPPIRSMVGQVLASDWLEWGDGVMGRLATSALVSSVVAYVGVLMHYFELRRHGAIRWYIKSTRPESSSSVLVG